MLSNISKALSEGEFESDVYLSLDEIQINHEKLILTIIVTYEEDDEPLQVWQVTCSEYRGHKLNVNYFEEFEVLEDHVFLWEYNYNSADLFFKGVCKNVSQTIGELFVGHSNMVDGQLPLETYLNNNYNTIDIRRLLTQGEGLFSTGPVNVMKVYEKILSNSGLKTSIIEFPNNDCTKYKIFMFGDSYVVAEDFDAFQIM